MSSLHSSNTDVKINANNYINTDSSINKYVNNDDVVYTSIADFGQLTLGSTLGTSNLVIGNISNTIKLNNNIELIRDRDNLIIVKNCNLAITFNELINDFVIFRIEEFEENFLDYNESDSIENDILKEENFYNDLKNTNYYFNNFINENIKSLCDIDENFYIDLKNKQIYQYSEKDNCWNKKVFGDFKLKLVRNSKIGESKKMKQEQFLLLEKIPRLPEQIYIPNYKNFNFNFGKNTFFNTGGLNTVIGYNNHALGNYTNTNFTTTITTTANNLNFA